MSLFFSYKKLKLLFNIIALRVCSILSMIKVQVVFATAVNKNLVPIIDIISTEGQGSHYVLNAFQIDLYPISVKLKGGL